MPIGDDWTLPIPANTGGGTFATQINAVLTELTERVSEPLTIAAIGWNSDADAENHSLNNVAQVGLYDQSSLSTDVGAITSFGGELYFISSAGAIQLTENGGLNVAALVGIVGDYGSGNPARVSFEDASATYHFYDDMAGGDYANVKVATLKLDSTAGTNVLTVDWGGSANATYTLPPAVPAGTALLRMESDGDIVTTGTVSEALTLSGVLTTSANVVLTGAAKVLHGNQTYYVQAPDTASTSLTAYSAPDPADASYGFGTWNINAAAADTIYFQLPTYPAGGRIKFVTIHAYMNSNGAAWTYTVYKQGIVEGVRTSTSIGTANIDTVGVAAADFETIIDVTDSTIGFDRERFIVAVDFPINSDGIIYGFAITYDVPS